MQEKSGKSRIDQLVEKAGEKLASSYTRRSFLGRVAGVAGAAMLGGAVVLGEKNAAEASAYAGCFSSYETNICYTGLRNTSGAGSAVRSGPSGSAPTRATVGVNGHFGRQSYRTAPTACNVPSVRASCNGYVWGYAWSGGVSGWVNASHFVSDTGYTYCGPAGADFDCNKSKGSCPGFTCGGSNLGTITTYSSYWKITHVDVYLRYAPVSTAHHVLVTNDRIHRIRREATYGWNCVTAICCAWIPYACHGWTPSDCLGVVTTNTGSCNPTTCDCPGG